MTNIPNYFHVVKFDRLEIKVYACVGGFYRVAVHYRNLPFQEEGKTEWQEVFGQDFDHLLDAVVLAEALAPTQEGKLEIWRKYSAMPAYLRKVANGEIVPGAE